MNANQSVGFGRRTLLGAGAALGVAAPLAGVGALGAEAKEGGGGGRGRHTWSVRAAQAFLRGVTDAHRTSGPRLAQSYQDGSGLEDVGFVYDNALTAMALLVCRDVRHARAIGDALIFAATHDEKFTDHRLRQAYRTNNFVNGGGSTGLPETAHFGWKWNLVGTAVGDMAWSGIALAQLAHRTRDRSYLEATLAIGRWIQNNTYSSTGLGGYTFGETAGLEGYKSSEHNIDVYAFFRLLAQLTGDAEWTRRAEHAWAFVDQMWNAEDGYLWTGSDDGATINKLETQRPLDVQTWAWLAARREGYASGLDWAGNNLATTDTPLRRNSALRGNYSVRGVGFATGTLLTDTSSKIGGHDYTPLPNDSGVWFEGTSQLALSLRDRGRSNDHAWADQLLEQVRSAQATLGKGQTFGGKRIEGGIVAASSPIDTGFKFGYYPDLHTAATSWYVFAATGTNPYRFF